MTEGKENARLTHVTREGVPGPVISWVEDDGDLYVSVGDANNEPWAFVPAGRPKLWRVKIMGGDSCVREYDCPRDIIVEIVQAAVAGIHVEP